MLQPIFYAILLLVAAPLSAQQQNDENAVKDVIEAHYKAWNQHDTKKMAALYASDGDLRTSLNEVGKNRAEIEKIYSTEHSKMFKEAHIDKTIKSIRMVKPDIAFVDVESTVTGMQTQDKNKYAPLHHRVVFLLVKREGSWKILAGRPF